jgi:catechol 2,3-dioxygenase-like lactoylglutathione lyase family enzyme
MATGIDHVVIAVNDLEQATADFTAAGFTVTPGGEHANGETHNALIAFSDGSYFEIIAWKNPQTASVNTWLRRLQAGEGLVDYALRVADLDAEVERLRAAGIDVQDPAPGGRTRPDGERVEWTTLRFDPEKHPSLPFYCHSTNDRSLRVPTGNAAIHANQVTGIEAIYIGVDDFEQAVRDYEIVAGIELTVDGRAQAPENIRDEFRIGTVSVVLIKPGDEDSDIAKSVATRGDVPVEVVLRSTATEGSAVDHTLSHGAKLAILGRDVQAAVHEGSLNQ